MLIIMAASVLMMIMINKSSGTSSNNSNDHHKQTNSITAIECVSFWVYFTALRLHKIKIIFNQYVDVS